MAEKLKNLADEVIEEDEFIEEEESGYAGYEDEGNNLPFIQKYGKWILVGAGIIFLGVVFMIYRSYSSSGKNDTALKEMVDAEQIYDKVASGGQAPDSLLLQAINGTAGFKGFAAIANSYSGSQTGNLANFYLGTAYLRLGQIDKGIQSLETFDKGDNILSATAYYALGSAYEEKQNWEKAAENYETASRTPDENTKTTPYFLMQAGRAWESNGKNDKALTCYKKIRDKYPLSDEAKVVEKYIGRITAGKAEE